MTGRKKIRKRIPFDKCIEVWEQRYIGGMKAHHAQALPPEKRPEVFRPSGLHTEREPVASLPPLRDVIHILPWTKVAKKVKLSARDCKEALRAELPTWFSVHRDKEEFVEMRKFMKHVEALALQLVGERRRARRR